MPRLSRRVHIIQDIMENHYVEEHYPEYTKYRNDNFEILKQKSFYMVVDKRQEGNVKVYVGLESAHKNIIRCS